MFTLWPIFKTLYLENSKGGQCVQFLHQFADFRPIGDSLQSKVSCVYYRGTMAKDLKGNFVVGDMVITRESSKYGHGAIISAIWGDSLQLTESNFYGDGRIHHGRLLNKYSPLIVGIIKVVFKKIMFIRRNDGQISLLLPNGTRLILSFQAWDKLGKPYAPTFADADYNQYPQAGVINDITLMLGGGIEAPLADKS